MSLLVVDSSVVIKWFVLEPYAAEARSIRKEYQSGRYTLLAPDFINAEVGNIVWKKISGKPCLPTKPKKSSGVFEN